jgi:hypothetical protein
MKKEIVEIDERYGKEYAGKYVFQEITWAKRNRILQKYTRYNPQTGSVVTTDYVAIQAETVFASLVEQPENKPITLERLLAENETGIPIGLGELLSKTANKLSIVSVDETKNC